MLKYVLKRILSALVTIFFIITITFFLMKAIPGNPFAAEKMPNPEIEAAMMAKYGLDQPLWKQYIIYLGNFLRGDFGVSYTKAGLTVNKVIADGFPFSLAIGVCASLVVVFAEPVRLVCALRHFSQLTGFLVLSPGLHHTFVLATVSCFSGKTLGLVPAFSVDEVAGYIGGAGRGAFPLSFITRLTRTSLVECSNRTTSALPGARVSRIQGNLQARPAQCPAAGGDLHRAHGGLHCHRLLCRETVFGIPAWASCSPTAL
ncbi:MAG: hypothetical protein ACLSUM_00755 [Dysosmobacter welbionis]